MDVNDVYLWVFDLLNKQQSGEITDDNFNRALAFVNLEMFRKEAGLPEDYQPGFPVPRMAWQITTTISDDLRNFLVKTTLTKTNDVFAYPANYGQYSSMYYRYVLNSPTGGTPTYEDRWVEPVTDSELHVRKESKIKPPTVFYPIVAYGVGGFQVFPSAITRVELTYLKIPAQPVRGYTQLANDQTQYDPATSVQIEWPETMFPNFAARIAKYFGITIREDAIVAWMQQRKEEGN